MAEKGVECINPSGEIYPPYPHENWGEKGRENPDTVNQQEYFYPIFPKPFTKRLASHHEISFLWKHKLAQVSSGPVIFCVEALLRAPI